MPTNNLDTIPMRMLESKIVQAVLVTLQFISAGILVLSAHWSLINPGALAVVVLGAVLGVWAWLTMGLKRISVMPETNQHTVLVTNGPYRWIRHPMYLAVVVFCAGFLWQSFAWWKLLLWLVLVVVVTMKAILEERFLLRRFDDYATYKQRTW